MSDAGAEESPPALAPPTSVSGYKTRRGKRSPAAARSKHTPRVVPPPLRDNSPVAPVATAAGWQYQHYWYNDNTARNYRHNHAAWSGDSTATWWHGNVKYDDDGTDDEVESAVSAFSGSVLEGMAAKLEDVSMRLGRLEEAAEGHTAEVRETAREVDTLVQDTTLLRANVVQQNGFVVQQNESMQSMLDHLQALVSGSTMSIAKQDMEAAALRQLAEEMYGKLQAMDTLQASLDCKIGELHNLDGKIGERHTNLDGKIGELYTAMDDGLGGMIEAMRTNLDEGLGGKIEAMRTSFETSLDTLGTDLHRKVDSLGDEVRNLQDALGQFWHLEAAPLEPQKGAAAG